MTTQRPRVLSEHSKNNDRRNASLYGEVRDKSPLYCEILRGAASDPEVIGFLLTLPREKRQPNLFLAAARHLFGTPAGWDQLRSRVLQKKDVLRAVMSVLSLHPAVAEVAVAGLPDERWGQRVTAFIRRGGTVDRGSLDAWCRQSSLADYKRPRDYVFIVEIPKSPVGKILRRLLVAGEYRKERGG